MAGGAEQREDATAIFGIALAGSQFGEGRQGHAFGDFDHGGERLGGLVADTFVAGGAEDAAGGDATGVIGESIGLGEGEENLFATAGATEGGERGRAQG